MAKELPIIRENEASSEKKFYFRRDHFFDVALMKQ
jgi:hypothetical protein